MPVFSLQEIPRSEDAKALQELHTKIKHLRPGKLKYFYID